MIGQEFILDYFKLTAQQQNAPRATLLIGPIGQGKRTLAAEIARINGWSVFLGKHRVDDVREVRIHAELLTDPSVYLFPDVDLMTVQAQNALLKIVEEPPRNAHFIFTTSNPSMVVRTIRSRVRIFELESYTKEQLLDYCQDEMSARIFNNIGQLERAKEVDVQKMYEVAKAVVENIDAISTANTFNILRHFDEMDVDLFIHFLQYVYTEQMWTGGPGNREDLLNKLMAISTAKQQLDYKASNKTNVLEMMFLRMQGVSI